MKSLTISFVKGLMKCILTGKEYNKIPMNNSTKISTIRPMNSHLNLRHTMNLHVLHGFENQKNEVSGRLRGLKRRNKSCDDLLLTHITINIFKAKKSITWEDPVSDSYWAHLCLFQQVSRLLPSRSQSPKSSPPFPETTHHVNMKRHS